ncbi:MAG: O-GlcNAcase NagJ precursor [Verrucomicrobiota bacterium]|jgi:protein O-GlcNAcase/histone acetyltransferase
MSAPKFFAGVIEGFYGAPWTQAERAQLFAWMGAGGLNTYVYAPKDDLKHRALWRETYTDTEAEVFATNLAACRARGIDFVYALSPGLDFRYGDARDAEALRHRCAQLLALGCEHFALLFDDLPEAPAATDGCPRGSLASEQCAVASALFRWLRERRADAWLAFCPTPYCGRMAARGLGGADYLETVGRELAPEIEVFWTGPEIISREVSVAHAREVAAVLRRPPLLWDNLLANDYDGRRFFCGPLAGRPAALRGAVRGLLINPNCELPLNVAPLHTLARYAAAPAEGKWDARAAYLAALRAWWPGFATVGAGAPLAWEEFVLFCDCFYLPHEDGAEAEEFFRQLRTAMAARPAEAVRRRVVRLRDFCARLTELRDRALFHALSRRAWELREELDLLDRFLAATTPTVASDFHLPGTYRGGFVPRLQRLLAPRADGNFAPP